MGRSVSTLPHTGFEMGQGSNQVLQRQRPAIAPGFGQRPPGRLGHKQAHDNDADEHPEPGYAENKMPARIAEKHREHAMELGVNHYLGKPYSDEELLSLIQHYARLASATAEV